jgi:ribosomal protein L34E
MSTHGPYCPTCHRRLHALQAPPSKPCLVCGQPVQSVGAGRPRQIHPECRKARALMRGSRRTRAKEVRP